MKIRFAIIRPETLPQVRAEVDMLQRAVNDGNMGGVDASTAKLLAWTTDCQSTDLSEVEWRKFLDGVRLRNPGFQSNYLLPGEICFEILPTAAAKDFVLELPIDEEAEKEVTRV